MLALYIAEKNWPPIPVARQWPQPHRVTLTLRDREDSAQHFVVSAALAAWAGEPAAEAIGVYKELDDARHGAALVRRPRRDRAGTRFRGNSCFASRSGSTRYCGLTSPTPT
ncbi:MAG: hypothetical protein IPJ52_04425 [Rhodocyclaceae bacterium]|nr:hypothetical protein [Rhodocyclaceae bacterium]